MAAFFLEVLAFTAKVIVVAVASLSVVFFASGMFGRRRSVADGSDAVLVVSPLNDAYRQMGDTVRRTVLGEKAFKAFSKARGEPDLADKPTVFVCDFKGDVTASGVKDLSRVVTTILSSVEDGDRVLVRLMSPGGTVPGYGLGASQLERLRSAGVHVTVAVDTVAASGGYMMAVVSDELVAAPFAIIGSIGVYLPVPNVNKLLKEHGVEFQELTSGKYKRTVTLLGEMSDEGVAKTQEMLDETHGLFKTHVAEHRPDVEIEEVATGEYWYAKQAIALGLVDRISTSDDVLMGLRDEARLLLVSVRHDRRLGDRLLGMAEGGVSMLTSWTSRWLG